MTLLLSLLPLLAPAVSDSIPAEVVEEEMVLKNGQIELPGTFTLPARCKDKVPAVVFVAGSGPNDRDETLGPNKPFRDLAWLLAKEGIASLRYDKRTKVYGARSQEVSGGTMDFDSEVTDDGFDLVDLDHSGIGSAQTQRVTPQMYLNWVPQRRGLIDINLNIFGNSHIQDPAPDGTFSVELCDNIGLPNLRVFQRFHACPLPFQRIITKRVKKSCKSQVPVTFT